MGAWWSYGLGTLNEDLPAYVVLPEVAYPQGGAANWSNGFLPPHFQGTPLRQEGAPILHMAPPAGVSHYHQEEKLTFSNHSMNLIAKSIPITLSLRLEWKIMNWPIACKLLYLEL